MGNAHAAWVAKSCCCQSLTGARRQLNKNSLHMFKGRVVIATLPLNIYATDIVIQSSFNNQLKTDNYVYIIKKCKVGRGDTGNHERDCGCIVARTACRGRVWIEFGILLPVCSTCVPNPHLICGCRTCRYVPGQTRWCVPLGGRSVR